MLVTYVVLFRSTTFRSRTPAARRIDVASPGVDDRARWNAKWAAARHLPPPSPALTDRSALLPRRGRALDLAGGTGRHAIWLALHGLSTTLVDVSDEACAQARRHATAAGVNLTVERRDLAADGVPTGPWDVVVSRYFLDRGVWADAASALAPGGILLIGHPTVRNLERNERPPRHWLLEEGEAAALAATWPGIEVVEYHEGWTDDARHEANLVLRRRVGQARGGHP
jgi:SAM-dependent methyltransferase